MTSLGFLALLIGSGGAILAIVETLATEPAEADLTDARDSHVLNELFAAWRHRRV